MQSQYIGSYTRPDGYLGGTTTAHLCFVDNSLVEVYPFGTCRSPFLPMDFDNIGEVKWYIANHPNGKYYS